MTVKDPCFAEFAQNVLSDSWGRGDFVIVVEERSSSDKTAKLAPSKRKEFRVSSILLSRASPVFKAMNSQENFVEGAASQVTISDFSVPAVEAFLRFLHFGEISEDIALILEVRLLADKYAINTLQELCKKIAGSVELKPPTTCRIFKLADRFHHQELKSRALHAILTKPRQVLKARPPLGIRLVQEVLETQALCIDGEGLLSLIYGWPMASTPGEESVQRLLLKYARGEVQGYLRQATNDALYALRQKGPHPFGHASHVTVLTELAGKKPADDPSLYAIAHNFSGMRALPIEDGWIVWMLPFVSLYLIGFCFTSNLPKSGVHFRIFCSEDGAGWQQCLDSRAHGDISEGQVVACHHHPRVKWLKLHVTEGFFCSEFRVRGIVVQTGQFRQSPSGKATSAEADDSDSDTVVID